MTIDFSKLSLVDALDLATLIEEEARDRYEELTAQMEVYHTPGAAKFFGYMSKNEEKHRAALEDRRKQSFPDAPRTVRREMIWDVEAPEYHQVRVHMTPREALETAMSSEVKAHDFFAAALASVQDPEVRALFEELKDEELHHQELVKAELAKLPPDDGFKVEDFEDDPVTVD